MLLLHNIVIGEEKTTEKYIEFETENYSNNSLNKEFFKLIDSFVNFNHNKSVENFNSSDDYDYNEVFNEKEGKGCRKQSLISKLIQLHEEGKNVPIIKNFKHINETFKLFKYLRKVSKFLFSFDKREKLKVIEFLSEIDIGLSNECSVAFNKIFSAFSREEFWALKCKSSIFNTY
jgi:hypothetical protein